MKTDSCRADLRDEYADACILPYLRVPAKPQTEAAGKRATSVSRCGRRKKQGMKNRRFWRFFIVPAKAACKIAVASLCGSAFSIPVTKMDAN